jgi:hypothetical protein
MADVIEETPDADYRFRIVISKSEVVKVVSSYILQSLDYDNFKAAQEKDEPAWPRFLHAVWGEGLRLQK